MSTSGRQASRRGFEGRHGGRETREKYVESHAKFVLKAIQYWNLCYNEKYENWFQEFYAI